jgi:uncharacterized protein
MRALGLPPEALSSFCTQHHIARLALFGSVLMEQARPSSDLDLLVEFELGCEPGLIALSGMEAELSRLVGRKVDLRTPAELSRYFRTDVLQRAEVQFAR